MKAYIKIIYPGLVVFCFILLSMVNLSAQDGYVEPDPPEVEKKIPTAPSIRGTSPLDGSQNLIRNAFVSARMDLLDRYQGVDAKSVTKESIKLYPANNPQKPVEAFITVNNGLKNIILEPYRVLEANTEYIFEINSKLVDLEGIPFETYKSSFRTGTQKLDKHIDTNKPRINVIAARKRIKLNALPEGYLIKKEKPKEEAKPTPAISEKEAEAPPEPVLSPQEAKKAKLEAAIAAKLAKYNKEREAKEEQATSKKAKPVAAQEKIASSEAPVKPHPVPVTNGDKEKEAEKAQPKESVAEETLVKAKEEEAKPEEVLPKTPNIDYGVKVVRRNMPLLVTFSMPKEGKIRFLIKNEAGDIVKKGTGTVQAGTAEKTIPTKNLPPGKYKIAIKIGDLVENHAFTILK